MSGLTFRTKYWEDGNYGGPVTEAVWVKNKDSGKKEFAGNQLTPMMKNTTNLSGTKYGYYQVENIQVEKGKNQYVDVTFETYNITLGQFEMMKYHNTSGGPPPGGFDPTKTLLWSVMKDYVTGYARIIAYDCYSIDIETGKCEFSWDVNNKITQIKEGQFVKGELNGYGRYFEVQRVSDLEPMYQNKAGFFNGTSFINGKGAIWEN